MRAAVVVLVWLVAWVLWAMLSWYLVALAVLEIQAAPMPAAKPLPRILEVSRLAGTWECRWGNIACTMRLDQPERGSTSGTYRCDWPGTVYLGTWGLRSDAGVRRLWITESDRPGVATSWRSFAFRIDPVTLSGPVEEGATGVTLTLVRRVPP
jgi:hypothetical protein